MSLLLATARGDHPPDLLLTNARIVNVLSHEIERGNVAVHFSESGDGGVGGGLSGRIAGIGDYPASAARRVIDLKGSFVAPGFIDAHMHVESTMLIPREFARLAAACGTTGVILDPHEIANVLGVAGIRFILDACEGLPLDARIALSSCVPSSPLETSGARLNAADLAPLFGHPRVVGLAEVMNYPGVVNGDPALMAKIALGLRHGVVDGHAPGLTGKPLCAYAAAWVSSDHECTTAAEAREKLRRGMTIFIREGSAARNLEALLPAITPHTAHRFCFCTDDRHPGDLVGEGHIDHVVRRAIALGLDPLTAIAIASCNTARHFGLREQGAIAPGRFADLVVFDDLRDVRARMVFFRGEVVAEGGRFAGPTAANAANVGGVRAPVRVPADLSERSFEIAVTVGGAVGGGERADGTARPIRVIGMDPHQLVTQSLVMAGRISHTPRGAQYVADPSRDLLKLAVMERHTASGRIGLGFVTGFGFARGALASTVGHDSHNLAVVGASDADMLKAAQAVAGVGGGQCVVRDGQVLALLALPIAGLMSDQPAATVIAQQRALLEAARAIGCLPALNAGPAPADPFMPLSFLPLPVIPHLKLTDLGLVDVDRFCLTGLEVQGHGE